MHELQKIPLTKVDLDSFDVYDDDKDQRGHPYNEYPKLKAEYDKVNTHLDNPATAVSTIMTDTCEAVFKELYGNNKDASFEKTEKGFNVTPPKKDDPMKFFIALAEKKEDFKAINLKTGKYMAGAVDGKMYEDDQAANKAFEAEESTFEVQEQPCEERGIGGHLTSLVL